MARTCGKCRECCTWMGCGSFDKPAGKACQHLTKLGCGIHANRHDECREYQCAWLRGSLDAEHRPDRMGVILSWLCDGETLHAVECRAGALEKHALLLVGIERAYHCRVSTRRIGG